MEGIMLSKLVPPYNVDPTTKNPYLTYALWFIAGFVGFHSFYLRDWWRGVVYVIDFALLVHMLWVMFSTVLGMATGSLILPLITWEMATPYLVYAGVMLIVHGIVTLLWIADGVRITKHINPYFALQEDRKTIVLASEAESHEAAQRSSRGSQEDAKPGD